MIIATIILELIEDKTTVIFHDNDVKVLYLPKRPQPILIEEKTTALFHDNGVKVLPRRPHPLKIQKSQMKVKTIPQWILCPSSATRDGIWSMAITDREAVYAAVLALSIKVCTEYLDSRE